MIAPIAYAIFLSDPILPDGAVSGNWLLIIAVAIIGFLFVRILNKIERSIETLTERVTKLTVDHEGFKSDLKRYASDDYIAGQNRKIAEIIYAKIKGMTPE